MNTNNAFFPMSVLASAVSNQGSQINRPRCSFKTLSILVPGVDSTIPMLNFTVVGNDLMLSVKSMKKPRNTFASARDGALVGTTLHN